MPQAVLAKGTDWSRAQGGGRQEKRLQWAEVGKALRPDDVANNPRLFAIRSRTARARPVLSP